MKYFLLGCWEGLVWLLLFIPRLLIKVIRGNDMIRLSLALGFALIAVGAGFIINWKVGTFLLFMMVIMVVSW